MQLSYLRLWICCSLFAAVTSQATLGFAAMPQNEAEYEKLRNQMVEIAVVGAGISDERVLKTMRATPAWRRSEILDRAAALLKESRNRLAEQLSR